MTEWQDFFAALAGVAGTAAVVLFALLQWGAGRWRGAPLRRAAAVLALVDVLVPSVAALVALMPGTGTWRVGYLVMGAVGLAALGWHAATYVRHEQTAATFDDRQLQLGLPLSLAAYAGVLVFASKGDGPSVYVVAALSLWLVVSAAVRTGLLLGPGAAAADRPPPGVAAEVRSR